MLHVVKYPKIDLIKKLVDFDVEFFRLRFTAKIMCVILFHTLI